MSRKGAWTRSSISGALEPVNRDGGPLSPQLFSRRFSKAQPFVIQDRPPSSHDDSKREFISSSTAARGAATSSSSTHHHHARTISAIPGVTATSNIVGLGIYRSPKSGTGLTVRASKRSKRILSGLFVLLIFVWWRHSGGNATQDSSNSSTSRNAYSYLPTPPSAAGLAARVAPLPLQRLFSSSRSQKARREADENLASSPHGGHTFHPNGLLLVNPRGRHPIHVLIEQAEKKWRALLKRQSTTLDEAVQEYKRRYKRNPPKGFEAWWVYSNSSQISNEVLKAVLLIGGHSLKKTK